MSGRIRKAKGRGRSKQFAAFRVRGQISDRCRIAFGPGPTASWWERSGPFPRSGPDGELGETFVTAQWIL